MEDYLKQRERERKREYHRKWRAAHPESVRAAQIRYWNKKAQESAEPMQRTENGRYHIMTGGDR